MAVSLDLLTRVRNIRWATGAFVIGDDAGYIWYWNGKDKPLVKVGQIAPENEDPTTYREPGTFYGSSYARIGDKPTFVIGGSTSTISLGSAGVIQPHGKILVSHDGRTWIQVFYEELREPREFIWDAVLKKFFVWMLSRTNPSHGDPEYFSECWSSLNGLTWTQVDSESGSEPNSVFESHCTYKYSDAASRPGKGIPDGQFGFNPNVEPNGLLITLEGPKTNGALAITFAGGIWAKGEDNAQDNGSFMISTDNAVTWKVIGQVTQPPEGAGFIFIRTITGGRRTVAAA